MTGTTEKELVYEYRQAIEVQGNLSKELKIATEVVNRLESSLMEMMEDHDKSSTAQYEGVGKVVIRKPQLYANVLAENQDKLFGFLRDKDRQDMIKTKVSGGSLSSMVREMIGNGESIPEFINYYLKPIIKLVKE